MNITTAATAATTATTTTTTNMNSYQNVAGCKRPRSEMTMCYDYPSIASSYKRPRNKSITPSSAAISIISPENDVSSLPPQFYSVHLPHSSSTIISPEEQQQHPQSYIPTDDSFTSAPSPPFVNNNTNDDLYVNQYPHQPQQFYIPNNNQTITAANITTNPTHYHYHSSPLPISPKFNHTLSYDSAADQLSQIPAQPQHQNAYQQQQQQQQQGIFLLSPSLPPQRKHITVKEEEQVVSHSSIDDEERRLRIAIENSFCDEEDEKKQMKTDTLLKILTEEIEELCYSNSSSHNLSENEVPEYHSFYSQSKQPFNLEFYIHRLITYSNCSQNAFIIMLIYIDRCSKYLSINEMNCHRIVLTSLVLAIKLLDDEVFSNTHYACVGGVEAHEMNQLESKLLQIVNWDLYVSPELFQLYQNSVTQKFNSKFNNDNGQSSAQLFSNISSPTLSSASPSTCHI